MAAAPLTIRNGQEYLRTTVYGEKVRYTSSHRAI